MNEVLHVILLVLCSHKEKAVYILANGITENHGRY